MDAQVSAFLKAALQFIATGAVSTATQRFDYSYGAYLYFNVGFKAKAVVLDWINWALDARNAYTPDRRIDIYSQTGSIDLAGGDDGRRRRRSVNLINGAGVRSNAATTTPFNETMSINALADPGLLFRREDDEMDVDSNAPAMTSPITCPIGDSKTLKIPELRLNCGAFPPIKAKNPTTGAVIGDTNAICQGIKKVTLPVTLTHAGKITNEDKDRIDARRRYSCKGSPCRAANEALYKAGMPRPSGKGVQLLECDEFPWAASEEGGDFGPAASHSRLCIPRIQNNHGGQCVKLLNGVSSNVGKMEPIDPPKGKTRKDVWAQWAVTQQPSPTSRVSF